MLKNTVFTRLILSYSRVLFPAIVLITSLMVFIPRLIPEQWIQRGPQVAFMADWDVNWDIYILDINRRLTYKITNNDVDNRYPSWSPDGERIIYHSGDLDNYDLYTMDTDGDNNRILPISITPQWSHEAMGAYSPDGAYIAYHSDVTRRWAIYLANGDGEDEQLVLRSQGDIARLVWSPDGTMVAFAMGETEYELQLWVMAVEDLLRPRQVWDIDGKQLTFDDGFGGSNWMQSWSPDSQQLVFVSTRNGDQDIYITDIDGTNQQNITNMPNSSESFPTWLPDGRIVFASSMHAGPYNNLYDLYIMDADGSNIERLTYRNGAAQAPIWRPN